jgi:hypothetical protein
LFGGGGNDLMIGAAAAGNLFVATNGNETLIGGGAGDTFNFQHDAFSPGGHATVASTYTVLRYADTDNLVFNPGEIKSQGFSGGGYTINLVDGSKIVLAGVLDPGRTFG